MNVTIANIVSYFNPEEGLPEEIGLLPIRKKLPFCGFHDCGMTPPRYRNGRVSFTVYLFSCKVRLLFEGAEHFVREDDFARVKRGTALQFLDCSIRKRGDVYEYSLLAAGAGEAKFTFRTAHAQLRGIIPPAEFLCKRLEGYRERLRSFSADERERPGLPDEGEQFPDADYFFFPYFDEMNELGALRAADAPFYALWRLHAALQEGDWGDAEEDKAHRQLVTGGYLRYFRECGYDLLPLLQKYAPHWAENFAAAREAYPAAESGQTESAEQLFRITARHLAGKWHLYGEGAAAMRYDDLLDLATGKDSPQKQEGRTREEEYEEEFVRALCAFAAERAETQSRRTGNI